MVFHHAACKISYPQIGGIKNFQNLNAVRMNRNNNHKHIGYKMNIKIETESSMAKDIIELFRTLPPQERRKQLVEVLDALSTILKEELEGKFDWTRN